MVAFQTEFCPALPPVFAGKDFRERQQLLSRMDELLHQSGVEGAFVESFPLKRRRTDKQRRRLVKALRCTLLRITLQLSYARMAADLAGHYEYQKFCGLLAIDRIDVPSAKTLERYEKIVSPEVLRKLTAQLNHAAASPVDASGEQVLGFEEPLELGVAYVDSTALKARVHYPVDWLLLRDAVRTLTLAIAQVRKHGIRSRLPKEPKKYLSAMNKLCIKMTHAYRTPDALRKRKNILRRMKKQLRAVEKLSRGHLAKLRKQGAEKGLSIVTSMMLEEKFTAILDQVDAAIHQAHERIIGGRRIANKDKILSLYEPDMHVIVRKKASAETEFGNKLFLAEQAAGLIIDWHLYQERTPFDTTMLPEHLERMEQENDIALTSLTGDRGFDSKANDKLLGDNIENNICPRNVEKLEERLQGKEFRKHQTRRAQTEARIAIVMHGFLGNPARKWGYANKARLCAWGILAHNLWKLARLPKQNTAVQAA